MAPPDGHEAHGEVESKQCGRMRAPFLHNYEFFALDTDSEQDALYNEVVLFVTESRKATISSIQR
ncbi:MAG: Ftsk gamma domain, partial [Pseudomonadota bacterium]